LSGVPHVSRCAAPMTNIYSGGPAASTSSAGYGDPRNLARGATCTDAFIGEGEECIAFGMNCGGRGGSLVYAGPGRGTYAEDASFRYVGYGGDYNVNSGWNCKVMLPVCLCFFLLCSLPLLLWWLCQPAGFDCDEGLLKWEVTWSLEKQGYCCEEYGRGCTTRQTTALPETNPTVPPTPFASTLRPADPFNCAINAEDKTKWSLDKHQWCCQVHHKGCLTTPAPAPPPTLPDRPADPFDCAAGFDNWGAGWSVAKKDWCCKNHQKGCQNPLPPTEKPKLFDCDAGYANWMNGWSVGKKAWCCRSEGKGCPPDNGGCE